jgi:hypothetical protein
MGESSISTAIKNMIRREFPEIEFDRHHCGIAKGYRGGMVKLGAPGWPDLIGYLPDGRFLGIEVKDPDGTTNKKRAELQTARREDINSKGGVGIITTGIEDCRQKLQSAMGG